LATYTFQVFIDVWFICCNLNELNSKYTWVEAADFPDQLKFVIFISGQLYVKAQPHNKQKHFCSFVM